MGMQNKRLLFLLGGGPSSYRVYADDFVAAAGGPSARMAVLVQTVSGWEKYREDITRPWIDRGVAQFVPVAPAEDGTLNRRSALGALDSASGILICGGSTPIYHRLFASDPVAAVIREKYDAGIPVAGISAGALISLEVCPLARGETGSNEIQIVRGLGLAAGFVIGVHFTEWDNLPDMLEVMAKTRTPLGFGIDEPACVVCEDGLVTRTLGKSVYRIEMDDFDGRVHTVSAIG